MMEARSVGYLSWVLSFYEFCLIRFSSNLNKGPTSIRKKVLSSVVADVQKASVRVKVVIALFFLIYWVLLSARRRKSWLLCCGVILTSNFTAWFIASWRKLAAEKCFLLTDLLPLEMCCYSGQGLHAKRLYLLKLGQCLQRVGKWSFSFVSHKTWLLLVSIVV